MPAPPADAAEATLLGAYLGQGATGSADEALPSGDRYVQQRLLGEGAMGAVYLVRDRDTGEQLAQKKLFRMDAKSVLRLKREFRSLADLSHPNLVRVYELGRARDGWFLTMEYVDGVDLKSYLAGHAAAKSWRAWLEDALMPAFYQLACGIQALHGAGMLHRDLKPTNVLVANHRVLVLDFGLVRELDPEAASLTEEGAVAGTPAYMAPEQALGQKLTEGCDWYAFGAMLYEALTGKLPFSGSVFELMRAKIEGDPQPPASLRADVPAGLSELCMSLLSRDPKTRPTGSQVLARLEPVRSTIVTVSQAPGDTSVHSEPQGPGSAAFFGRERELGALWDALHEVEAGRAVDVHVRGISGAGKSALVEHFLDGIEDRVALYGRSQALVLRSRCYEREAMPFKALDGVIDALGRHLAHVDDVEVGNLLPTHIGALVQLFPVLERLRAVQRLLAVRTAPGDAVQSRQLAENALRELFQRLASRRPVVIWIDDLQWGDLDSAGILRGWLQGDANVPVLLVLSYRADEVSTSPCLRALLGQAPGNGAASSHTIEVSALATKDLIALCRDKLGARGREHEPLVERIVREAQGSPFLAEQLARLARAKLARGDADVGTLSLTDLVAQLSNLLSSDERQLLRVLSVAGRPLAPKLALRCAGIRHGGRELVHSLRRLQLVRTREVGGERLLEVYHDRVREGVTRLLSTVQSEQLHASLLAALEYSNRAEPDWLYAHAIGARQQVAAYRYGIAAAERAMTKLAFERAAELYAHCLEIGAAAAEQRRELMEKLALALDCCGHGRKAADAYLEAARLAQGQDAARLTRLATSHLFRSGRFDEAEAQLQRGLDAMGLRVPKTQGGLLLGILWERLRFALRGPRYRQRDASEVPAALLARFDAVEALRHEVLALDPVRAAWFGALGVRWAFEAGEPMRVLHAIGGLAYMASTTGGSARAERMSERWMARAEALAAAIGTPAARASLCMHRALTAFMLRRLERVVDASYEAERLYREHAHSVLEGSYYERGAVVSVRVGTFFATGDYRAFERELTAALYEARSTENVATELNLAFNETLLDEILDRSEASLERLERQRTQLPRAGFGTYHLLHLISVAIAANATGQFAWGRRMLDEGWTRYLRSPVRRAVALALYARIYRLRLLINQHVLCPGEELSVRQLHSECDAVARVPVEGARANAAALRARLLDHEGKRSEAIVLMRTAIAEMKHQAEIASAQYALAAMLGGDEGEALRAAAERQMSELGVANPRRMLAARSATRAKDR